MKNIDPDLVKEARKLYRAGKIDIFTVMANLGVPRMEAAQLMDPPVNLRKNDPKRQCQVCYKRVAAQATGAMTGRRICKTCASQGRF